MRILKSFFVNVIIFLSIVIISPVTSSGVMANTTAEVSQSMVDQAEADVNCLLDENDRDVMLKNPVTDFIRRWLEIPVMKFKAAFIKPFIKKFRHNVPVPDSDMIYSWIEELCSWEHRRPGTDEGHAAEEFIFNKFKEIGLQDVSMQPIDINVWEPKEWSLTVEGETIPCFFSVNTALTDQDGISAPLAYVGLGLPGDFNRVDVKDKIAVVEIIIPYLPSGALLSIPNSSYFISDPDKSIDFMTGQFLSFLYMNIWPESEWDDHNPENAIKDLWDVYDMAAEHGAKGVVLLLANKPSKYNTQYGIYDGVMRPVPAVWVGKYDAIRLRRLAKQKKSAVLVQAGDVEQGHMNNVWGVLPGRSDDTIIICSHQDSAFKGAVEDGTGIAQVFAQAWAWAQVPQNDRPKTLVFVATAGHLYGGLGGFSFAYENKEIMERTWLVMNLEHLAAEEVKESRGEYKKTGQVAPSIIWTTENAKVLAALSKAIDKRPARRAVSLPSKFFGLPVSDVPGYIVGATANGLPEVPVISWISSPYYLLDEQDTLDKVAKDELEPIAGTITEIVKNFMMLRSRP